MKYFAINPDFAIGVRTLDERGRYFLRKKKYGIVRRIPRPIAKSGLNLDDTSLGAKYFLEYKKLTAELLPERQQTRIKQQTYEKFQLLYSKLSIISSRAGLGPSKSLIVSN